MTDQQLSLDGAGTPSPAPGGAAHPPTPRRRRPNRNRWQNAIHYSKPWTCDWCGEPHEVAVIRRRDESRLLVCEECWMNDQRGINA